MWSENLFGRGSFADINGGVGIRVARLTLVPDLVAADATATVRFAPNEVAFEQFKSGLNGGALTGELKARRVADGVALKGQFELKDADAARLPYEARPVSGRLRIEGRV
ncbi:MAG: hypothetical protein M5U33_05255 [Pseudorhodoplanes sp.]|nr:hypothetical protein [Pseudorhodoplanes sp.]